MTSAELKYLITINKLYDGTAGIKLTEIAAAMGITKVSVYKAAVRLENGRYVERDEKNRIIMTEYGYNQLEQYNLIISWLGNHLQTKCGVSAETAQNDAIGAACALSDESRTALADFIEKAREKSNYK